MKEALEKLIKKLKEEREALENKIDKMRDAGIDDYNEQRELDSIDAQLDILEFLKTFKEA